MNNKRIITINKGEEHTIPYVEIDKKECFTYDCFKKAETCFEEISNYKNEDSDYDNHINNIIAFCGERGQGKTTMMVSYARYLRDKKNCHVIKVIDPTILEQHDNILMIVVSSIYNDFKEHWSKGNRHCNYERILELFNKAFHHIMTIKSKSNNSKSYDYDEIMENLDRYGQSLNLKEVILSLITEFLGNYADGKQTLIIPIDDTDLNIMRAYEIVEDIRKYLQIPKVIVLMASKIEQLSTAIEQHFRSNLKSVTDSRLLDDKKFRDMTSKYLEKLIPETRRIMLPKLNIISDNGEKVTIKYMDREHDVLEIYGEDLQHKLLNYIEIKTGIHFEVSELKHMMHPIVPSTMRELANLLSVLSSMKDVKCFDNNRLSFINNTLESYQTLNENLVAFYTYFSSNWILTRLSFEDYNSVHRIMEANINTLHMQTLLEIKKRVDGFDKVIQSVSTEKTLRDETHNTKTSLEERISGIIANQTESNTYLYSLGNIMDAIAAMEGCVHMDEVDNFLFAIKTVYTIKMMLMAVSVFCNSDNENINNDLIQLIGIDYIGECNSANLFPAKTFGKQRLNRGRFYVEIDKFIKAYKSIYEVSDNSEIIISDVLRNSPIKSIAYLGYKDYEYNYNIEKSKNNAPFRRIYWNISFFFINSIRNAFKSNDANKIIGLLNIENVLNKILEQIHDGYKTKGVGKLLLIYKDFFERFRNEILTDDDLVLIDKENKDFLVFDTCLDYYSIYNYHMVRSHGVQWSSIKTSIIKNIKGEKWSEDLKTLIINKVEDEFISLKNYIKDPKNVTESERILIYERIDNLINSQNSLWME